MRYTDLFDAHAWRKYQTRDRVCRLISLHSDQAGQPTMDEVRVQWGVVTTGKSRQWAGYFSQVIFSSEQTVLVEDPHNLITALKALGERLSEMGWRLDVIGLDDEFRESGLSANTGYGFHPSIDGAVHIFDPRPKPIDQNS
jgi:hypothetical protein